MIVIMILILIIAVLLLIILYLILRKTKGSTTSTTIEKTSVVDMKVDTESTIKLDLKPVVDVKSEDYDTMVGHL